MDGVSASVNLPLHHKVQKFSFATRSPGWSRKKGRKMSVYVCVSTFLRDCAISARLTVLLCSSVVNLLLIALFFAKFKCSQITKRSGKK